MREWVSMYLVFVAMQCECELRKEGIENFGFFQSREETTDKIDGVCGAKKERESAQFRALSFFISTTRKSKGTISFILQVNSLVFFLRTCLHLKCISKVYLNLYWMSCDPLIEQFTFTSTLNNSQKVALTFFHCH